MDTDCIKNNDLESTASDEMVSEKSDERLAEAKNSDAKELYEKKYYRRALDVYNEVIELCPHISKYYANRAACYMMLEKYRDAVNDARKSVELDPKYIKGYERMIKCCLLLGELLQAETTLLELARLDPNNKLIESERRDLEHVQRYLKEGDAAYAAKDFRKVVYCMDRCCDVSSYCPRFNMTRAECLIFLERYQEAENFVTRVYRRDACNADALYLLGLCLYFQDKLEMAVLRFKEVLKLAPDHTKALEMYRKAQNLSKRKGGGNLAYSLGHYLEAYKWYTEALQLDPQNNVTNKKLHYNKATVLAKLGRLKESTEECTKSLKLDENYVKPLLRRANNYMEFHQYEEAVRDLEKACQIDKNREIARLLMGAKALLKKSKRKDYYKILGIDKNASTDDVKKAYRKRAMVHHPDRHSNATEGEKKEQEKKFKEVAEAYGVLSDPKNRSRYDSGHDIDAGNTRNQSDYADSHTMFQTAFCQGFYSHPNGFHRHFTVVD